MSDLIKKGNALCNLLLSMPIGRTFATERVDMPTEDFRKLRDLAIEWQELAKKESA